MSELPTLSCRIELFCTCSEGVFHLSAQFKPSSPPPDCPHSGCASPVVPCILMTMAAVERLQSLGAAFAVQKRHLQEPKRREQV